MTNSQVVTLSSIIAATRHNANGAVSRSLPCSILHNSAKLDCYCSVSNDPIGITIPLSKAANCIAFRVCVKHSSHGSIGDVGGVGGIVSSASITELLLLFMHNFCINFDFRF